ncbi:zinc finger protein RFP-like isoform X2 [Gopherus evgoodei]|uniref:zinc finger protein RFP-like isoform X2 n=1 Tax=Gopherus evgoodei TaxID=1825980 RepID=UPI0011CFF717|nr:zinc finger protein RFP-like isoform X2 [Gopherus evgoodei]
MAADSPVQRLQDEASCSICLEYFKDPVSIHCGHNFCRACITNYWEESDTNFSCPQCRETAQQRNFRPNRELAKIIEIAKRLSLQAAKGSGGERVCEKHQETLKLFCEEDQAPICVICRESQAHRAHMVVPIEEAAQEYKEKIQIQLQILKEEREKLMGLKLTKEARIWEHLDVRSTLSRCELGKVPQPEEVSPEPEKTPSSISHKYIALKETLRKFQVDVTLDPDTAHPRLVLSEDGKSVRWEDTRQHVPDNPKRFDSSRCVLGLEGFSSGRHYWEVEVEDGGAWAVGVARESVRRKGRVNVNPEEGIWAVGQCGTQYLALTSPKIPLSLAERPRTIGIYLDCEEGRVAFFDADNEGPIFTFPPASVPGEKILPLLCLGRASQFRLCPCITGYNVEP